MALFIGGFLGALLSPSRIIVCLIIVGFFTYSRGLWFSILMSGILSFILVELLLMETQSLRVFGQGLLWALPASFIHGALSYYMITYFRKKRT